jgi:ClpP class serine protease
MVDFVEGNDEAFITSLSEEMREPTEKFIADVKVGNPRIKDVPGMFTGATFSASKAVEYGMIDAIGNEKMAIEKAMMLATLNSI